MDLNLDDTQHQRPLLEELTERTQESEIHAVDLDDADLEYKRLRLHVSPRLETEKEENNNIKTSTSTSRGDSVSPDCKRKRLSDSGSMEENDEVSISEQNSHYTPISVRWYMKCWPFLLVTLNLYFCSVLRSRMESRMFHSKYFYQIEYSIIIIMVSSLQPS